MKKYIILLSVAAFVFAACESPKTTTTTAEQTTTQQTYEFTINAIGNTMADMAYDVKELKVTAGSTVKINLMNTGTDESMLHNIVFVRAGTEKAVAMEGLNLKDQNYFDPANTNVIAGSSVTTPGSTTSLEFTAPEAGTYSYICTYPGHWQSMRGTLIVE